MECFEPLSFLAASQTRIRILRLAARRECVERDAFRDRLDATRTTVQRNLDALVERGWLSARHTEYAVTPAGRLVAESLSHLDERLCAADRITPLVEHAPVDAFGFDLIALADATVVTAEPGNPYRMVDHHVDRLRGASSMRAALPVTGLHALEATRDALASGATVELVVTPDVAQAFQTDERFAPVVADLLDADRLEVHVTDAEVPFLLGLLDHWVQVGVDEDGQPRALVESTSDEVREWAERRYQAWKADTRVFEPT